VDLGTIGAMHGKAVIFLKGLLIFGKPLSKNSSNVNRAPISEIP